MASARSGLSREARLVFGTATSAPEGRSPVDARLPTSDADPVGSLDWSRLVRMAEHELASAALWRLLRREGAVGVPATVAEYLTKSASMSDFRMQHLSGRLQSSVRELRARGVPVMLLKGAAVGAMSDPTFRERPMNDIDLLVRPEDVVRARDALLACGWTVMADSTVDELLANHHHLPPFLDPQLPGLRLELHVSLLPSEHSFGIDEAAFWQDATEADAPFAGAWLPSAEHLLFHTCVHFAWSHSMSFGAWRTIRSISAVAESGRLDWDRFVALALRAKGATACYWTLRLASALSGFAVPASVLPRLAAPSPERLRRALERHFITSIVPGEGPMCPSVRLARLLWIAALRPRWSGHRSSGRIDPEQRWERTMGTATLETSSARTLRHLRGLGRWWRFVTRTLIAPAPPPPPGTPTPR